MEMRKSASTLSVKEKMAHTKRALVPAPEKARVTAKGSPVDIPDFDRGHMVAQAAYYRAERRGFASGAEIEDWLEAESEIDRLLQR